MTVTSLPNTYDAHVDFLMARYGDRYERLTKTQKAGIGLVLMQAIAKVDDEGQDVNQVWFESIQRHGALLPLGFSFQGLTNKTLDSLIRRQFQAISNQIHGLV